MAVFRKELKMGSRGLCIWTLGIGFMLIICILLYPEMKSEMEQMNDMFANMGSFTQAFGMDKLNFGTLKGYYGVECGNMMGLMGGLYAAYLGITILSKEEREHTAEFLLVHPVDRSSVVVQKLAVVVTQVVVLNLVIFGGSALSVKLIGEELPMKEWVLLHVAYLLLQLEISMICFGVSAFLKRGSIAVGLGIAAIFYFMNLLRNISEDAKILKYITPYAYADAAGVLEEMSIDTTLLLLGVAYATVMVSVGFWKYVKKDIAV